MTRLSLTGLRCMSFGIVLAGTLITGVSFAQGPGGPPPFGGPPPISVAMLPLSVLDSALKLSAAQAAQITRIEQQFRLPPPGRRGGGPPPGGRPFDSPANAQIRALLTADQKKALPALLAKMNALGIAGIPPPVYGDLHLSADQEKQIVALGQSAEQVHKQAMAFGLPPPGPDPMQQTHEKAMTILTNSQRLTVEQFLDAHPRPGSGEGPGGRNGGFGPPPPDGFGPPPGGGGEMGMDDPG